MGARMVENATELFRILPTQTGFQYEPLSGKQIFDLLGWGFIQGGKALFDGHQVEMFLDLSTEYDLECCLVHLHHLRIRSSVGSTIPE